MKAEMMPFRTEPLLTARTIPIIGLANITITTTQCHIEIDPIQNPFP